ncbi:TPA: GGDEF domain-containing protein [Vibrio campbellii]|nr:GGDEF domain-containing protein [Vibrio campbellii]
MDNFSLDIRTLNFIIILFSCIYSIGLLFTQYKQRKIPGLTCFAVSLLFIGGGPFLLSFRDGASDWITIVASNTAILTGFLLTLYGVSIFRSFPLHLAYGLTAALPLATGLTYYFTFHIPSIRIRIVIISAYLSTVTLASGWAMIKGDNQDHKLPLIGMAASLIGFGIFMAIRVIWSYFDAELTSFMSAGLIHQLTFLFSICLVVSMSFCMLWLINSRLIDSIENLSIQDALTGLLNRRAMEKFIPKIVQRVIDKRDNLCIIMMDIDNFKHINDAFGHLAGDQTIIKVAKVMLHSLPKQAQIIRFGGDEFMIVLPKYTLEQAAEYAENIRVLVRSESYDDLNTIQVTMSFGVAKMVENECLHDVICRSDRALYHSKEHGRDQVTILSTRGVECNPSFLKVSA